MAYDSDIDRLMARTATRPIPMGHVAREDALTFGWLLSIAAVATMGLFVNFLAAGLLAFTVFFYVGVYTLWLKRRTPQNIVIGGLAGALPPAIGWASVTGDLPLAPLLLVAIIFMWTPPHFWALALFRNDDYARAGVPMLPVTAGDRVTRNHILGYSLLLVVAALAPAFSAIGGPIYLAGAVVLNAILLHGAWAVWRRDEAEARGKRDRFKVERRFFAFSILYLALLFALFLVEAALRALGLGPAAWPVLF
jgi:protoheme IX farnesyltransferase